MDKHPIITVISVRDIGNGVIICMNDTAYMLSGGQVYLEPALPVNGELPYIATDGALLAGNPYKVAIHPARSPHSPTVLWYGNGIMRQAAAIYGPDDLYAYMEDGTNGPDITNYRLIRPCVSSPLDWRDTFAMPRHEEHGRVLTSKYLSTGEW